MVKTNTVSISIVGCILWLANDCTNCNDGECTNGYFLAKIGMIKESEIDSYNEKKQAYNN